jgi:hypothetical protein
MCLLCKARLLETRRLALRCLTVGAVTPLDAQNAPGELFGGGARNLRYNFINVAHDQDVNEIFGRLLVGRALTRVHVSYLTDLLLAAVPVTDRTVATVTGDAWLKRRRLRRASGTTIC